MVQLTFIAMSWLDLQSLANRAESMLNQLDETAAATLQKKNDQTDSEAARSRLEADADAAAAVKRARSRATAEDALAQVAGAKVAKPASSAAPAADLKNGSDAASASSIASTASPSSAPPRLPPATTTTAAAITGLSRETKEKPEDPMVAENRVLRREVAALNDELVSFARRAKSASTALEEEQRRSATQNEQSEALRSQLKELHETLDKLRQERDGALTDQAHVSGMHSSVIDSLTRRCDEAEAELERERNAHEQTRSEIAQQLSAQHEEHDSTARALADTQQQLDAARSLLNGHKAKATKAKQEYDSLRSEHDEYKARAARVLESKEKLISELKRSAVNGGTSAAATTTGMGGIAGAVSHAEFLEMTSERDNAREECALLRNEVQQLRHELLVAEQQASADAEDAAEELARVRTAVEDETQMRLEAEQDALVRVKEAERARDDALRLRQLAQAQLSERDADIEKLRRQVRT